MNYAGIIKTSIVDGTGIRTTLFLSGCPHHCPGCHNPETWDKSYGKYYSDEVRRQIQSYLDRPYCDGLTISGGEPMWSPYTTLEILKGLYFKSLWLYTGYTWEELMEQGQYIVVNEILQMVDVLVDGPYIEAERDLSLPFRGSRNQRLIDCKASLRAGRVVLWEPNKEVK